MADAMVTARMPQRKKDEVNRILGQHGTNASQMINRVYDEIIRTKRLPYEDEPTRRTHTPEEIAEALAWADSLVCPPVDPRFATMTTKEAKIERLIARGLLSKEEVGA